eukprot:5433664-Alexandrium_andersonii.AAC.1
MRAQRSFSLPGTASGGLRRFSLVLGAFSRCRAPLVSLCAFGLRPKAPKNAQKCLAVANTRLDSAESA